MNSGLSDNHASITYYDSDYPSAHFGEFKENFDETVVFQGLQKDVERYIEIAKETKAEKILEVCAGSGRVSIPLARENFKITAVDISKGMLDKFENNLINESKETSNKINLVNADATKISLGEKNHCLAIIAFNSLLCIPNFNDQISVLKNIYNHLLEEGILVIDIVNPAFMNIKGDQNPKIFFTRKNTNNGNTYSRIAMSSPMDETQKQELYGWYDEELEDGLIKRTNYSMFWRPIYRFEIELMLNQTGFEIQSIEGGHNKEIYTVVSNRMFITAKKKVK